MRVLDAHAGTLGSPYQHVTAQELALARSYAPSVEPDVSEGHFLSREAVGAVFAECWLLGAGSRALGFLFSSATLFGHQCLETISSCGSGFYVE